MSKSKAIPAVVAIAAASLLLFVGGDTSGQPKSPVQAPIGNHGVSLLVIDGVCWELVTNTTPPTIRQTAVQYDSVIVLGGDGPVPPNPPTPVPPTPAPTPGPLTERAKSFQAVAAAISGDSDRATTAQLLSAVYRGIAPYANAAAKDQSAFQTAIKTLVDNVLGKQKAAAAWQPFRDKFNLELGAEIARGAAGQSTDYGKLLNDAADGLQASVPAGKSLSPELLAFLKWLLETLLPYLLPLIIPH